MAMYDPQSPSQQDVGRRHRLPSSISGPPEQLPMREARMGADEALIISSSRHVASGPEAVVLCIENERTPDSTATVYDGVVLRDETVSRRLSELFGLRKEKEKESAGNSVGKEEGGKERPEKKEQIAKKEQSKKKEPPEKKRKASRRLSEMLGFGHGSESGVGGESSSVMTGLKRRLSSITLFKGKFPPRKDSAWPAVDEEPAVVEPDDRDEAEVNQLVPQNTATTDLNNHPYPSQAFRHTWRQSQDAETISEHWTPAHSAAHSGTNLLRPEPDSAKWREDTQEILSLLPQLERCQRRSQWQEIQRASSNLILADKAVTPPNAISSLQLSGLCQRAPKSLERVQKAYDNGYFDEAKTFQDDRESSPEAQIRARDDYLEVVAARRRGADEVFKRTLQLDQPKAAAGQQQCCNQSTQEKEPSEVGRSSRNVTEDEQRQRSVGSEMAQLAGVIGSSMQQAHTFM